MATMQHNIFLRVSEENVRRIKRVLSVAHASQPVERAGWRVRGSNPVGGARFYAPVQSGFEAHPASYTVGTVSFPWVKRTGRGVDHPPHLAPRLKEE